MRRSATGARKGGGKVEKGGHKKRERKSNSKTVLPFKGEGVRKRAERE